MPKITFVPGRVNLADPLTKVEKALTEALQLTLLKDRLNIKFQDVMKGKTYYKNYG